MSILSFWDARTPETPTYWEEWYKTFHWGMIADYDIDPDDFFFNDTLDATAIAALPGEVNGKKSFRGRKEIKIQLVPLHWGWSTKAKLKRLVLKRRDTDEFRTKCKMYLNGSESLHMSEDCFTEESRETTKQSRNFMQN